MVENIELSFSVPEQFDGCDVEIGLVFLEKLVQQPGNRNEGGLKAAYRVLYQIHATYVDKVGHPEWKRPQLDC